MACFTSNCITGPGALNPLAHLDQKGKVMAEYIWLGGASTTGGFDIRGKTMTLDKKPTAVSEMKVWNYDGSSTGQAPGEDSEVLMRPVRIFPSFPWWRQCDCLV